MAVMDEKSEKTRVVDASLRRALRLVTIVTLVVAFFLFVYGCLFYWLGGVHPVLWGYAVAFFMAFGTIPLFKKTQKLRHAINYLLAVSLGSLLNAIWFTGGLMSPALIWLVVVPAVGGHFLSTKDKIAWGVAMTAIFAGFLALESLGVRLENVVPAWFHTLYLAMTLTSATTGALLCIVLFDHDMQSLLERSTAQEAKIRTLLRALLHDLGNPLTAVTGAFSFLNAEKTARNQKWLEIMERGIHRMTEIITRIRDLERARSGKMEVSLESVRIVAAIDQAVVGLQHKADAKGVRIKIFANVAEDLSVRADVVTLINQVLANIISNAIKFSHPGDTIDIIVLEHADKVLVTIKDRGVGMPAEMVQQFERNGELSSREGTSGEQGTGFGLPICKSFIESYGGQMLLDSKQAKSDAGEHGTTITLQLQKQAPAEPHKGAA